MAKSIDYRPWILFTLLGAVLITVLVLIGKKESYCSLCTTKSYSNDDDDDDTVENYGISRGARYATNSCINRFSRYY